ncbi:MAG: 4-hydroxythreonine-4-phosphate dehydrogenase PdxA [Chloroflexota bacterium]|nr:4-hydroxythreonine-4-phosphate dehydrogenase PdxA [Chloroflexota bacterium]MDE2946511.1 4-hydroxythreonine-4-phosphate dehydrogenase PdxA [Chloroflexota bacterium]
MKRKPVIAIAMGDPAGIGPELIVKVLSDAEVSERCRPFIIGDIKAMRANAVQLDAALRFNAIGELDQARFEPGVIDLLNPPGFELGPLPPPQAHPKLGEAAARCLALAYELALQSRVDGVVMAPMNKESFRAAGYDYLDELQFLGELTGSDDPFILGAAGPIWALTVTEHIPFKDIVESLSVSRVGRRIAHLHGVLRKLGYAAPRIACAALNPHAGEGGLFGSEEINIIAPAILEAQAQDIDVSGPVPADIVFKRALDGEFDGVVCMYHDQMNIARKLRDRGDIATLWMGLPVIGATTAHGTAFDIAGKGIADPGSLRAALDAVIKLA